MDGIALVPVFVVGLLGSVHCAGMCGGIVGALSAGAGAGPARRVVTIAPVLPRPARAPLANVLSYNLGRIGSYALAGALAGGAADGIGRGARALVHLPQLQAGAYWLANLMLLALGLYLMDAWRGLARLEQGGQLLWRRVQPLLRRIGPLDSPARLLAAGGLWGWLPCGMVYSVLATAMLSGSALRGALVMLAFGLGTLPMLLAMGALGARLRAHLARRGLRLAAGALVLGFGMLGLARAAGDLPPSWLHDICLTPGGPA